MNRTAAESAARDVWAALRAGDHPDAVLTTNHEAHGSHCSTAEPWPTIVLDGGRICVDWTPGDEPGMVVVAVADRETGEVEEIEGPADEAAFGAFLALANMGL